MLAVIFEVTPAEGKSQSYFDIAKELRPYLETLDGFISVERFQSLTNPNTFLSLSFWDNENAIQRWREFEQHCSAQNKGRTELFKDYHIRVAQVVRDYSFDR